MAPGPLTAAFFVGQGIEAGGYLNKCGAAGFSTIVSAAHLSGALKGMPIAPGLPGTPRLLSVDTGDAANHRPLLSLLNSVWIETVQVLSEQVDCFLLRHAHEKAKALDVLQNLLG